MVINIIIYKINPNEFKLEMKIFDESFVKNNFNKFILVINNKKEKKLLSTYIFKNTPK